MTNHVFSVLLYHVQSIFHKQIHQPNEAHAHILSYYHSIIASLNSNDCIDSSHG
jgi:hypothetical protein